MKVTASKGTRLCQYRFGFLLARSFLLFGLGWSLQIFAQVPAPANTVKVGIIDAPPFVITDSSGNHSGICIHLWKEIAKALNLETTYHLVSLKELLAGTESGDFDVALAPLAVTSERERHLDFTHAYYTSGLGIAVHRGAANSYFDALRTVFNSEIVHAVGLLLIILVVGGYFIWYLERRVNREQFGGTWFEGLGSGLWWSATTVTTVGYGDKAPRTPLGRLIGFFFMLVGILVLSSFTAAITSAMTVSHLEAHLSVPDDLMSMRTAAVEGSAGENYLRRLGLHPQLYSSVGDALTSLVEGRADAVVAHSPLLRYTILTAYPSDLVITNYEIEMEQLALAFPQGYPLREEINRALLDVISRPEWQATVKQYLGSDSAD